MAYRSFHHQTQAGSPSSDSAICGRFLPCCFVLTLKRHFEIKFKARVLWATSVAKREKSAPRGSSTQNPSHSTMALLAARATALKEHSKTSCPLCCSATAALERPPSCTGASLPMLADAAHSTLFALSVLLPVLVDTTPSPHTLCGASRCHSLRTPCSPYAAL